MELAEAIDFARGRDQAALLTIRASGRPQISNVVYVVQADGGLRVGSTDTRAKTLNLRRDPRCSLYIPGESFFSFVVIEGTAELSAVARRPEDSVGDEYVAFWRALRGHDLPDEQAYRGSLVEEGRVMVRIAPERAYGLIGATPPVAAGEQEA